MRFSTVIPFVAAVAMASPSPAQQDVAAVNEVHVAADKYMESLKAKKCDIIQCILKSGIKKPACAPAVASFGKNHLADVVCLGALGGAFKACHC